MTEAVLEPSVSAALLRDMADEHARSAESHAEAAAMAGRAITAARFEGEAKAAEQREQIAQAAVAQARARRAALIAGAECLEAGGHG